VIVRFPSLGLFLAVAMNQVSPPQSGQLANRAVVGETGCARRLAYPHRLKGVHTLPAWARHNVWCQIRDRRAGLVASSAARILRSGGPGDNKRAWLPRARHADASSSSSAIKPAPCDARAAHSSRASAPDPVAYQLSGPSGLLIREFQVGQGSTASASNLADLAAEAGLLQSNSADSIDQARSPS